MRKILFTTVFIIIYSINSFACQFTVSLSDTYGDGWNGNSLTIKVNGTNALTNITLSSGNGPTTYTFNANTGDIINVVFNQTGTYIDECSYVIKNPNDSIIFSEGPNITSPSGVTFSAYCPPPTCTDGIMNGDETWIDCGGTVCNPCPPCGNGIQDGNETGVDCGGPDCPACIVIWNINNVNNQTITTCNGTLYDSGGPNGDYGSSESYTVTFCSGTSDNLSLNINYDTESSYDNIYIYDGINTSSTLIATFTGSSSNTTYFSTGTCVTIKFTSDGSVVKSGFSINISCLMNDEPCAAWPIIPTMSCAYSTYTNANSLTSSVPAPTCGNYNGHDVWYKVIVPGTGELSIKTISGTLTDMAMAVYQGTDCDSLILLDCSDDDAASTMPNIFLQNLTPDSIIYIRLWDVLGNETGTFSICVINNQGPQICQNSTPASDFCTTATPICTTGGYCGNTSNYYTASEIPTSFCGSVENNSWLSFIASDTSATLNVWTSNCSQGDGIQMEIYSTTNCSTFTSVSNCVSEGVMSDFQVSTNVTLTIGETYYLMIDGYGGDFCEYIVSANNGVALGNPIIADVNAATNNICYGDSVQLVATGGQNFLWSPTTGLDNPTIANPIAKPTVTTQYIVKVYGNGVCDTYDLDSIRIYVSPETTVNEIITNASCYGSNSGSINISVNSTNPPYSYNWSNGATTEDLNNINAGTYTVDITDNSGCSESFSYIVTEPTLLTVQYSIIPENTGNDASITITSITGGIAPYNILWSTGDTINIIDSLTTGIYNLTITDSIGCILNQAFVINNAGCTISTEINVTNPICYNANNGYAIATVQSGTEPYSYSWSNGTTNDTILNISAGMYFLTVTDLNTCITIDTAIIINPTQIISNSYLSICSGDSILLGNNYQYSSGTYYDTLSTTLGCDSIIRNYLTVINPVFHINNINICNGDSIFLENAYQYSNGTFHDTLSTVFGCDSIIITNLTVTLIDTTVLSTNISLYSNFVANNYQWINCNGNIDISGEISQTFYPAQNGNYALILSKNGCIDTSGCHNMTITQLSKNNHKQEISIFPNPAGDKLYININANSDKFDYSIFSIDNRLVYSGTLNNGTNQISVSKLTPGIYFTRILVNDRMMSYKIVVNR